VLVSDVSKLVKAELHELDAGFHDVLPGGKSCTVQFNPESLKVSFANHLVEPSGGGDKSGPAPRRFIGAGMTKLALTLWFDVGSEQIGDKVDDVRKLTRQVAYFIEPAQQPDETFLPPAVRFTWGSFQFDGMMDSVEESLEYFSPDGRPLRASVAIGLSQQKYQFAFTKPVAAAAESPGSRALARAAAGSTVQALADAAGRGDEWQSIAAANGIENPRAPGAGTLIDMDLRAQTMGSDQGFAVAPPARSGG
jgi:hypothetical protein